MSKSHTLLRHRLVPVLAMAALGLLAACGDSPASPASNGKQDVASIASASPTQAPAAQASERPLIRTDTSAEEVDRLYDAWGKCLEDHGVPRKGTGTGDTPAQKQAAEACEPLHPESVWERAKRLDPEYGDKLRDWVTCIRAFGIDAWEENGFLAFNSLPSDADQKHVDECQRKVFGNG